MRKFCFHRPTASSIAVAAITNTRTRTVSRGDLTSRHAPTWVVTQAEASRMAEMNRSATSVAAARALEAGIGLAGG